MSTRVFNVIRLMVLGMAILLVPSDIGAIISGRLVKINSSEGDGNYSIGGNVRDSKFSPSGLFVAAISSDDNLVRVYSFNPDTGTLSLASTALTGSDPRALSWSPNGQWIAIANFGSDTITLYEVDPASGQLSALTDPYGNDVDASAGTYGETTEIACGVGPIDLSYSPNGSYLTVVNNGSDELAIFRVNGLTGQLTKLSDEYGQDISNVSVGSAPVSLSYHLFGQFVAIANSGDNTLSLFRVNPANGQFNPVTNISGVDNSIVATGSSPQDVAYSANGQFLGVVNTGDNTISMFSVNPQTGELTSINTYPTGSSPSGLHFSGNDRYLSVSNQGDSSVRVYYVDLVSGELSMLSSTESGGDFSTGDMPKALHYAPTSQFLVSANQSGGDISVFRVLDNTTGRLTRVLSSEADGNYSSNSTGTHGVSYSKDGRFLLASHTNDDDIAFFSVMRDTGRVVKIPSGEADGNYTVGIATPNNDFSPNGRFVTVAQSAAGRMATFEIDQSTGLLTLVDSALTGSFDLHFVRYSPNGQFVAGGFGVGDDVVVFRANQETGALTRVIGPNGNGNFSSGGTRTLSVDFSPCGKFLAVGNVNSNNVSIFSVDQGTGYLNLIQTIASGTQPTFVSYSRDGRFLASTNAGQSDVTLFSINPTTGIVTKIVSSEADGNFTSGSNVDFASFNSNGFLLASVNAQAGSSDAAVFLINQVNGQLTRVLSDEADGNYSTNGGFSFGAAFSPNGLYLATANAGTDDVTIFRFDPDAALEVTAYDDFYSTNQGEPLVVAAPGILGNDISNISGCEVVFIDNTQPSNGSVTVNSDGSFIYTPNSGFSGLDSFMYTITDCYGGGIGTGTVFINVNPVQVNAYDDFYTISQGSVLSVPAPGILGNDISGTSGCGLIITANTQPSNGTVVLNSDGSFTYTPDNTFFGVDSFTYAITDCYGRGLDSGTVFINVTRVFLSIQSGSELHYKIVAPTSEACDINVA